ncbi:NAD(P)-binding protein [Halobaculum litoreum]|uniref:NAD(P)-binding protein n=1 Tax=Halobaculum litoreum TaxID=3031998 RepID=A0ABD5XSF1_9EURY
MLVVGGGVAGLSAATFLSRYGLDTLVLARGKSAIGQCAHLENYLGFPAGISPERFLALGREQATYEGATVREELVECVATVDLAEHGVDAGGPSDLPASRGGFAVDSDEGSTSSGTSSRRRPTTATCSSRWRTASTPTRSTGRPPPTTDAPRSRGCTPPGG